MFRPTRRDDHWDHQIARAESDHALFHILANHVFPLEILIGAEVAQLRTFAIPSIARLLHATRQYEDHGQRRVDDTRAILTEIGDHGTHTAEGQEMVRHLNAIHSHYRISNDDFLATLAALVIDPMRTAARLGWRAPTAAEKEAVYRMWQEVGHQMHIADLPADYEALVAWRAAYEAEVMRYTPANEAVTRGLLAAVAAQLPRPLRPLATPIIAWLVDDDAVLAALGLTPPRPWLGWMLETAAAVRRRMGRAVDWWRHQRFWDTHLFRDLPSYPEGYDRRRLGPPELIARMARDQSPAATS